MDIIKLAGGETANFLDVGGTASAETVKNGFRIILADENVKSIFLDKNNFLGCAVFNGNKIYRKIVIENGNIQISDFSNDTNLNPYENWGELNEGVKFKFSKGYKRIN